MKRISICFIALLVTMETQCPYVSPDFYDKLMLQEDQYRTRKLTPIKYRHPLVWAHLQHGANPNVKDKATGNRPLHYAAKKNDSDSVSVLLSNRADPTVRNNDGKTPRDMSTDTEIREMLQKAEDKAKKKQRPDFYDKYLLREDKYRTNKLDREKKYRVTLVWAYLQHGANPNVKDKATGNRPLHYAAKKNDSDSVSVLLEHRADPTVRNNDGKTPRDMSTDTEIREMLRKAEDKAKKKQR